MNKRKTWYRKCLLGTFVFSILFTIGFTYYYIQRSIPDQLNVVVEETEIFQFPRLMKSTLLSESEEVVLGNDSNIPSDKINLQVGQPFSVYAKNQGSYQLGLKLFGMFQIKEIQVNVVDTQYAIPCGTPVGLYLESDGIMVIGTGEIVNQDGIALEPANGILQSGDYIQAVNGVSLKSKEELVALVNQMDGGDAVLNIRRHGESMDVRMNPVKTSDGDYKLGVWVRNDTQGIGTMTYVDMNGNFGALGHGISDSDTGAVVEIKAGNIYDTEIVEIEKGTLGKPGVMSGVIYYGPGSTLGSISTNTDQGIFGKVNDRFIKQVKSDAIEVGYRQDVHKGEAYLRSSVSGEVKDYLIEIQKVDYAASNNNKGLVIKVVDEELLALTGGIVQGMSGSPIIQDGKLVGAVTHVFIQDSSRGYGIFLENMLEIQQK